MSRDLVVVIALLAAVVAFFVPFVAVRWGMRLAAASIIGYIAATK